MIYGLNFNGRAIPQHLRKRFALTHRHVDGYRYDLKGICETEAEAAAMRIQANNGHRAFVTVGPRHGWIGFYVRYL